MLKQIIKQIVISTDNIFFKNQFDKKKNAYYQPKSRILKLSLVLQKEGGCTYKR